MKIAVVGCGAVGSYYGGRLARAGQEVHFLLRSDYEIVRRQGVRVRSFQGDFHAQPSCARLPEEIGPSDLVLIGLKTTANDQLRRLLPPLVGPATAVLTLQNGLGNEEQLARLFPSEQILGGLCFVCLNRLAPGLIHHIAHGQIVLGEFRRRPERRTQELASLFGKAAVPCSVTDDLARTHWEKLTWNIPFNGLGVAGAAGYEAATGGRLPANSALGPCLPTEELLAEPRWKKLLHELMLEVIGAARALGFELPETLADEHIERTGAMGAYKASTLLDFEHGLPLELDGLFLEPLRQAREAKVPVPRLTALCRLLEAMEGARRATGERSASQLLG
ncbi:MAG: 2-dehydropantoate 2-reductase [Verrucomicrobiota bacterium]|jgi:2-dehydropantoate 2-reductase